MVQFSTYDVTHAGTVVPEKVKYTDLEPIENAGNLSKNDIWAFESRILAHRMVLNHALSTTMLQTVDGLDRKEWKESIEELNKTIGLAEAQSIKLYERVVSDMEKQSEDAGVKAVSEDIKKDIES